MITDLEISQFKIEEVLAGVQESFKILFIPAIFSEEPILEIIDKFLTGLFSCLQTGENCEVVMETALPTFIFCIMLLAILGTIAFHFLTQPDRSNILTPSDKDYQHEDNFND